MKLNTLFFTLLFFLSGCDFVVTALDYFQNASSKVERPPLYNYKADMVITVDGLRFTGIAVANMSNSIDIKIKSKARLYVLSIETCSRHFTVDKADKNWFGGVGKEFEYRFRPNEKEKQGNCPMYIRALDLNGTAAWGMVHFKTNETLKAKVSCNGSTITFNGLTACQTKSSLIQSIHFDKAITAFDSNDKCNLKELDNKHFEIRPENGFCFATFFTGLELHRAVFLGFNEVFVRGD